MSAAKRVPKPVERKKVTIMLESGELDKALSAFVIANGYASLGMEVTMWFMMWGHNCLRKRRSLFAPRRRLDADKEGAYRTLETDTLLQPLVGLLNRGGAGHLPLSMLNLLGIGPALLKRLFTKKGVMSLEELIQSAHELGVEFKACQICFDALGHSVEDLIVPGVKVSGVAEYARDSMESRVNLFI
jgi:peroxiredoxin family protein